VTASDIRLEAILRAGSASSAWPTPPDLRDRVVARIRAEGREARPADVTAGPPVEGPGDRLRAGAVPTGARRGPFRLVRALAIALVASLLFVGVAAALGFRLPGLEIIFVDRVTPAATAAPPLVTAGPSAGAGQAPPVTGQPPAGDGLGLGTATPLAEARAGDGPRLLLPADRPEPSTAWVLGSGARRIITVAWRAPAGGPTIRDTDLDLALTVVAGTVDEPFLTKMLGPGTSIERLTVAGERGWWISGAPHDIVYRPPDGSGKLLEGRLAGDTLVFARDGTLYRLESALGRDGTIAVAESLR
jgi:hypothetical protein